MDVQAALQFAPIRTKLQPLSISAKQLKRPRLLLANNQSFSIASVTAPAGYGKSTLLAQWHQQIVEKQLPTAWLSCDEDDNDIATFTKYLVAALDKADSQLCQEAIKLIQSGSLSNPKLIFSSVISRCANSNTQRVLFIDDLHVIKNSAVLNLLQWLVERLPDNLILIIASRRKPQLKLSRLKLHGKLIEFDAVSLSFTSEETQQYFKELHQQALSENNLIAIQESSEGWILALQLFSMLTRNHTEIDAVLRQFSGKHQELADYLGEVVIDSLDKELRNFLINSSCLERMCAPLCDAIFDRQDSDNFISQIDKLNLFLIHLDQTTTWFRYHHLFGGYLRVRLEHEDPSHTMTFKSKASEWFEQAGSNAEAIHYALQAKDYQRASELLSGYAYELVETRGDSSTMLQWLQQLPDEYLAKYPAIWTSYILSLIITHQIKSAKEKIVHFKNLIIKLKRNTDASIDKNMLDELECFHDQLFAQIAIFDSEIEKFYSRYQSWKKKWTHSNIFSEIALSMCIGTVGFFGYQYAMGLEGVVHSQKLCLEVKNYFAYAWSVSLKTISLISLGKLNEAIQAARWHYETVVNQLGYEAYGTQMMDFHYAEALLEKGEIHEAKRHLHFNAELLRTWGGHFNLISALSTSIRINILANKFAHAIESIELGKEIGSDRNHKIVISFFIFYEILYHLKQNQVNSAKQLQASLLNFYIPQEEDSYLHHFQEELYDKATIKLGLYIKSLTNLENLLQKHLKKSLACNGMRAAIYYLINLAVYYHLTKQEALAQEQITLATKYAMQTGCLLMFVEEGLSIKKLIIQTFKKFAVTVEQKSMLNRLLILFKHAEASVEKSAPKQTHLIEQFTKRELQILQALDSPQSNREIAEDLFISEKTLKWHLSNVYDKLQVNSRVAAVSRARELRLI